MVVNGPADLVQVDVTVQMLEPLHDFPNFVVFSLWRQLVLAHVFVAETVGQLATPYNLLALASMLLD